MRLRPFLLSLALAAGALWPVAGTAPAACAGEAPRAALVVDTGDAVLNFCVALPGDSVSGIDLIKLASKQHGLSYKLGFGGAAVCRLAGVGPTGDDCFEEDPDFWGYWRGDGSGGWNWSGTGASNVSIRAGDTSGWSWGTGDSGSTHPQPPATTYETVCGAAPAPDPKPKPDAPERKGSNEDRPASGSSGAGGGGATTETEAGGQEESVAGNAEPGRSKRGQPGRDGKTGSKRKADDEGYEVAIPEPTPTTTPASLSNPAGATARDPGTPSVAFIALGLTAALAAAGVVLIRRRRRLGEG